MLETFAVTFLVFGIFTIFAIVIGALTHSGELAAIVFIVGIIFSIGTLIFSDPMQEAFISGLFEFV